METRFWTILLLSILLIHTRSSIAQNNQETFLFVGASNTPDFPLKLPAYGVPWSNFNILVSTQGGWGWKDFVNSTAAPYSANIDVINEFILDFGSDYILFILGTADLGSTNATDAIDRAKVVLDYIQQNYNETIILTTIIWMPAIGITDKLVEYQVLVEEESNNRNLLFADFYSITENHTDWFGSDGIHFNNLGIEKMAAGVDSVVRPLIFNSSTKNSDTDTSSASNQMSFNIDLFIISVLLLNIKTHKKDYQR